MLWFFVIGCILLLIIPLYVYSFDSFRGDRKK
jgi:hypothetical protein